MACSKKIDPDEIYVAAWSEKKHTTWSGSTTLRDPKVALRRFKKTVAAWSKVSRGIFGKKDGWIEKKVAAGLKNILQHGHKLI